MEAVRELRWRRQRLRAMLYLYMVFLLSGVLVGLLWRLSDTSVFVRVRLLSEIATSLGFVWFCSADARLVGRPLLPLARVGIFLFWPAGVPIYLLWARRFRGLGLLLLHGVLLFLVYVTPALATAYLVYGDWIPE